MPGHDYCEVVATADGYRLEGVAVYLDPRGPARIEYAVDCDHTWDSRSGALRTWIGDIRQDIRIERRSDGAWRLDGQLIPGLEGCADLDYGFTPATNLLQTRRIALDVGEAADVPAVWIEPPTLALTRLPQRYERVAPNQYRYESPTSGYHETLEMADSGFVRSYPGLWVLES